MIFLLSGSEIFGSNIYKSIEIYNIVNEGEDFFSIKM